jgi:hypothetical protein
MRNERRFGKRKEGEDEVVANINLSPARHLGLLPAEAPTDKLHCLAR